MKTEDEIFATSQRIPQITRDEDGEANRYWWRKESRCVSSILAEFMKNNIEWDMVMITGYHHLNSFISKYKETFMSSLVQFSSVTHLYLTLCDPRNHRTPGLPVHHQLPESTQTHVYWVDDAIQPSHPLSSPSPPALNLSYHQGLFKWISSLHQVAKVLEF